MMMATKEREAKKDLEHLNSVPLFVSNIPLQMDETGLRNVFNQHGRVVKQRLFPKNDSYATLAGVVEMQSWAEAMAAMKNVGSDPKLKLRVRLFKTDNNRHEDHVTHLRRLREEKENHDNHNNKDTGFHLKEVVFKPERRVEGRNVELKEHLVKNVAGEVADTVRTAMEGNHSLNVQSFSSDSDSKPKEIKVVQNEKIITNIESSNKEVSHPNHKRPLVLNNPVILPFAPPEKCYVCNVISCFRCSRCQKAWYCTPICQGKDWPRHMKECMETLPKLELMGEIVQERPDRPTSGTAVTNATAALPVGPSNEKSPAVITVIEKKEEPCASQEGSQSFNATDVAVLKVSSKSSGGEATVPTENDSESIEVSYGWKSSCLQTLQAGSSLTLLLDTSNDYFPFNPRRFPATRESEGLENILTTTPDKLRSIEQSTIGKGLYCVLVTDEAAFRGVVIDTKKSDAKVCLIDFGYSLESNFSNLYEIPSGIDAFSGPALSVMVDVECNDDVDDKTLERLKELEEVNVVINHRKVVEERLWYCKATICIPSVDQKNQLSLRAVLSPWTSMSDSITTVSDLQSVRVFQSDLSIQIPLRNDEVLARVAFGSSTNELLGFRLNELKARSQMELLLGFKIDKNSTKTNPKINEMVVVNVHGNASSSGVLCRAQVLALNKNKEKARLRLIDYGTVVIHPTNALFTFPILPQLVETPPIALKIVLADVPDVLTSMEDTKHRMSNCEAMLKMEQRVEILSNGENAGKFILHHPSGRTLNEIIAQVLEADKADIKREPGRGFSDNVNFDTCQLLELRVDSQLVQNMFVTHVESPSKCFVIPEDQLVVALDLLDQIAEYGGRDDNAPKKHLQMGEVCIAMASDKSWYRAVLVSEKLLFFPDFGFAECVDMDKIREVPNGMMKTPFLANQACFECKDKSLDEVKNLLMSGKNDPVEHEVVVHSENDGIYKVKFPKLNFD